MKRILFGILFVVVLASTAFGSPFLTCDDPPQSDQVTHYKINGEKVVTMTEGKALWYDLASIPDGDFQLQIQACSLWGCSAIVPFAGKRAVPAGPVGNRIDIGE